MSIELKVTVVCVTHEFDYGPRDDKKNRWGYDLTKPQSRLTLQIVQDDAATGRRGLDDDDLRFTLDVTEEVANSLPRGTLCNIVITPATE